MSNVHAGHIMTSNSKFGDFNNILVHYKLFKDISNIFLMFGRFHALDKPNFGNLSLEGATFHLCLDWFFIWYSTKTYWDIKVSVLTKNLVSPGSYYRIGPQCAVVLIWSEYSLFIGVWKVKWQECIDDCKGKCITAFPSCWCFRNVQLYFNSFGVQITTVLFRC